MAKQYTQITLEEIQKYLKRAFGSMPAKRALDQKGEICLDMEISDNVGIRVYTSVHRNREDAAGLGEDAMRVLFWNLKNGHPLKAKSEPGGKALPVQRTQGWKDTLRRKLEDLLEEYYEREEEFEARAVRPKREPGARPNAPSEKQVGYARSLLRQKGYPEPNWDSMTSKDVSRLIDDLRAGRRPSFDDDSGEGEIREWEGNQF